MQYHPLTERLITQLTAELPQGTLLTGPSGVGLSTLAHKVGRGFDTLITITPEGSTISIDRIRELYTLGRSKGSRTVFIIDDADAMSPAAQNAFLKLLEEPIADVRFILTSHAPERLLPTVRSRTESHAIRPISTEQSNALLDELGVTDASKRSQLLFIAAGLPAQLARLAHDDQAFAARIQVVRDARTFLSGTRGARLILVSSYKDRDAALSLVRDMQRLLQLNVTQASKPSLTDALDVLLDSETALIEQASVRLSLTQTALLV